MAPVSLSHTFMHTHRRTSWGVSERHSSDRANVINEAHWSRLAWDNHSCRVCHHVINSDDRPSLNLWKVMGPGLGAKDINSFVMCCWVFTKKLILKVGYSCVPSQFLDKLSSTYWRSMIRIKRLCIHLMKLLKSVNTLSLSANVVKQKKIHFCCS